MASLYDAIRKPWAAWEMTMEGHDPTNFRCLDFSGNGRHLTLGNGAGANEPTKLTQKRGYRNDGGNPYLRIPGALAWTSNAITLEMIVIANSGNATRELFSFRDAANTAAFTLLTTAGVRFYSGGTANANSALMPYSNTKNGVMHVVGRYNGTNTSVWVDGRKGTDATTPLSPAASIAQGPVLFQAYSIGGVQLLPGDIYLCRIWDVALTDIQIQELHRRAKRELHRI